jgi:hypothetical protein
MQQNTCSQQEMKTQLTIQHNVQSVCTFKTVTEMNTAGLTSKKIILISTILIRI